ncbi:hypothetical protein [Streptomyces rubiginosohelvolus]|uniref:hypothetical protein n=1 Tax=Streptomyces rubiginosohelvolus TaxID=67362 RepID=UPI0035E091F2
MTAQPEPREIRPPATQLEEWFQFLRDRSEAEGTPQFSRMVGFAHGYATAMLELGREDLAMPKIGWLMNESLRFSAHPDYPLATAPKGQ